MLGITIPGSKLWDEANELFINTPEVTLLLEHSLVSMSKWESITEKPFLGKEKHTREETILYISCMNLAPSVDEKVLAGLTTENLEAIRDYIDAKMTATVFKDTPSGKGSGEFVTNEIVYYWMIALNIPMECQYWHLNRLLTLVKVLNLKNAPAKKMNRREQIAQRKSLNEQRRAQRNTNG